MIAARIVSIASLIVLCACAAPADQTPSPASGEAAGGEVQGLRDGRTTLAVGQTLLISLPSNATTGYAWTLSGSNSEVLKPGTPFGQEVIDAHAPGMVGVGGNTLWRFLAGQPGTVRLSLAYRRAWETNTRPAETATYTIVVR
ncbi:protease inhibitor I42 family protein [Brevundimonas sp.]|uniref:protease inhibitor I42 family protein n=1 Tax=Brevundimonas sp. TaxID=1871086 RepID=UPI00260B4010|nr:protease inhibitor I42 family protein [Brevundimonas sp.]